MINNPDNHAAAATEWSKAGRPEHAFWRVTLSIRAREFWVLVNGKWVPRKGVMRPD